MLFLVFPTAFTHFKIIIYDISLTGLCVHFFNGIRLIFCVSMQYMRLQIDIVEESIKKLWKQIHPGIGAKLSNSAYDFMVFF